MTDGRVVHINDRWPLWLPEHRAARAEWPWWEAQRLAAEYHVISSYTRAPTVYCVGAEEGDFPALYASWGANVVMFEPNERVWPNIKAIFETNRITRRVKATWVGFAGDDWTKSDTYAVSAAIRGSATFPDCADGAVISDHGFCNLWERPDIPTYTIDRMVPMAGAPSVITIDVEGAELRVLTGAAEVLQYHKPAVFVSIHPEFMRDGYGDEPDHLRAYMNQMGYMERFLCTDHEQHWYFQHSDNERMAL